MEKLNITLPFKSDEPVVLALSGGRDSMCLLDILLKKEQNLIIAFVNHHQRPEADIEEKYIESFAKSNSIPIEILSYFPKEKANFQAEAHKARYDFFYNTAKKYNAKYLLTAHHKDDVAETIILRLIKGSNLFGYGISEEKTFKDIKIIRPLISLSREDIDNYVSRNNIFFFEDSSNAEDHYLRNRIRHNIIPKLKEENPNVLNNMLNFSIMCKESFEFIRNTSLNYLRQNQNEIKVSTFNKLPVIIKKDIINYLLEQEELSVTTNKILGIIKALASEKKHFRLNIKRNYYFIKSYDRAFILYQEKNKEIETILVNLSEEKVFNNKYKFSLTEKLPNNNAKYLKICYNDLRLPIIVRKRQNGDKIVMPYGTKKIKNLFIEKKVPMQIRDETPIITDSDGNILWVYDYLKKPEPRNDNLIYLICEVL